MRVRDGLRRALGIQALHERIDQLETRVHESSEATWDRSRARWRQAEPTSDLTWDRKLTGDAFVKAAAPYAQFSAEKSILEIGPGYGRLLQACLELGVPFSRYCGLDLSERNVRHLRTRFSQPNVSFVHGDVDTVALDQPFDVVLSSLTFKHLYPSMDAALGNLAAQLNPEATLCIDLIEGTKRSFEEDGVTFVHEYARPEVTEMLERIGLEHVAFDTVEHEPDRRRLLMVARRPA